MKLFENSRVCATNHALVLCEQLVWNNIKTIFICLVFYLALLKYLWNTCNIYWGNDAQIFAFKKKRILKFVKVICNQYQDTCNVCAFVYISLWVSVVNSQSVFQYFSFWALMIYHRSNNRETPSQRLYSGSESVENLSLASN